MPDTTTGSARTLHGEEPFATHLDSVIIFDAQTQRCIAVNAAAIRSYGYSRAEFVGLTAEALCAPGRVCAVAGNSTGGGTSTTAHRRKDGTEVDVDETVLDFVWDGVAVSVLFATDVTQRVRTERELRESLNAHSRVHRLIDLGHWWVDLATGRTTWSDELFALARLTKPADASPGTGTAAIRCHAHPDDQERVLAELRDVLATGRVHRIEYRAVRGDAPTRWVEMLAAREDDANGKPIRLVGTVVEITERKVAHELLRFNARHDALTGLPNRTHLHERLAATCAGADGQSGKAAVLCLDLDHFKQINDTLGHATGDQLLQSVATRLQAFSHDGNFVARTGGDEFAVIFGAADAIDPAAAACAVIRALADPFQVGGRSVSVSASIGLARYPGDGTDVDSLFRSAATAMYHAKRENRGSFRLYESAMRTAAMHRFGVESGLRHALGRDGLRVHYQPIVSIDGRLIGSEALVRWPHHDRLISAAEFIPIAEDTGLVIPLDAYVLAEACRQNALWQQDGRRLRVAVNVSAHSIVRPDFTASVQAALRDSGLDPSLLELELTESAMQDDLADTARKVAELRSLGIGVALDDFGTGYNSLSILRSCRFDTVKLDQTFVSDIETHDADSIIAEAVISAAHRLGAQVVAEGVETEQQLEALADLNCDHAQGYLFGAALSPADFASRFVVPRLRGTIGRVA